ncbi:chromosome partitioning protein [Lentzea sp. NPDC006480]|uniref:MinD/ParA family ATP-binding protein n=1 Tax=Lentzea sp. NPDC006480 TaxID=3157176 RepID=UPI0033AE0B59
MLIAICSLKSSPGVTTLAVALGARWPSSETPVVVEADPAGGDLLTRFRLNADLTVVGLAASSRVRGNADPDELARHVQFLPGGLRVVPGPIAAEQSRAALGLLVPGLRRAGNRAGTVLIVDCGRVDPESAGLPIIRSADAMVLLARPRDDELAHVALKLQLAQQWSRRPCFVLMGRGHSAGYVSRELGVPVLAHIPRDVKGAAALRGDGANRNGPSKSALGRAAAKLAFSLRASVIQDQAKVDRHLVPGGVAS